MRNKNKKKKKRIYKKKKYLFTDQKYPRKINLKKL